MMINSICVTRTDGFCDYKHKWYDIEDLENTDYEDLCEDMDLVGDEEYLLVTDCEGNVAKEFLKDTNTDIIDRIDDALDYLHTISMTVDVADELLDCGAEFMDLIGYECIASSMEDYVDTIIDMWEVPDCAKDYIDRESLQNDLEMESIYYETENYGLWVRS